MRVFNRLFGIGLPRTGNTSLCAALEVLGLRCVQRPKEVLEKLRRGVFEFDALRDHRAMVNCGEFWYPQLDCHYPGSLFILTTRRMESWLESYGSFPSADIEGKETMLELFGCFPFSEERFRHVYRLHCANVLRWYLGDRLGKDLLCLNLEQGDGWGKLCGFLEVQVPPSPFPHLNRREDYSEIKR